MQFLSYKYMASGFPGLLKLFLQLKDKIERIKHHYKLWGILFVEYLLLYSVTLTLSKSLVIKRCNIDVGIFVRLQEIIEKSKYYIWCAWRVSEITVIR
jgi:hypothetical protein